MDKDIEHYLKVFKAFDGSGPLMEYAAYVLIGVGAFVLIVGFFGCCGAIKESRCMLGMVGSYYHLPRWGGRIAVIVYCRVPARRGL